jgi:hypothetical protein
MKKWFTAFLWSLLFVCRMHAQTDTEHIAPAVIADTVKMLPDVQIHAYDSMGLYLHCPPQ